MKLTIFGASGRTGQHLLRQALQDGHQVTALVRDPAKISAQKDRLTLVQGSLTDPACLDRAIAGADAVISVLGPAHNRPTFDISQGMQAILAAMQKHGVCRLVITAGAGVGDPGDRPGLFNRLMNVLLKAAAKNVYEDMRRSVALVRASGLDWTVVRVPMLTDAPATGRVQVGMVGAGMGPRITRADLANFLLREVAGHEYVGKAPAISN